FNYLSLAWYVTRTFVPNGWQGERIYLRVGSACYLGTVYVNGTKVGSHEGGHLPFAFEITEQIKWGEENVIAISVENELKPTRVPSGNVASPLGGGMLSSNLPTTFDFFPFAGLHRPVVLYSVPQTHIEDITVKTDIAGSTGTVHVDVKLNRPATIKGRALLSDAATTLDAEVDFSDGVAQLTFQVANARFWSDTDPHLYTLTIKTDEDLYTLPVGIRTVAVEGGQILLNGKPVKLNGFGRHEDFIASGKGLNLPLMVKDYALMRWTGANSYRTSHYPYSEEEMQLADREGFLIIDEIPAVSLQFESDEMADARLKVCLQQLDELIVRDKNHPSVLMWCVANEPLPASLRIQDLSAKSEDESIPRGRTFLETLLRRARELDATRL
ncbi:MAG: hypothetical protein KDE31_38600, partial [Caldilineaceae bacterium]|nr:hypothetical protein [Caldilineaceae bacterium]